MGDVERIKNQWRSQNAGSGGGSVRDGSKTSLKDRLATMSKKGSGSSSPASAVTSFRKELRKSVASEPPKTPKSVKRLESDSPIASSGSKTARTAGEKSLKVSGDGRRTASGSMTERLPRTESTSSRRPSLTRSISRRGSLSVSRRGSLTKSPTSPTSPRMSEKQKRKNQLIGVVLLPPPPLALPFPHALTPPPSLFFLLLIFILPPQPFLFLLLLIPPLLS